MLFCFVSIGVIYAQDKFSGHIYGAYFLPQNDFTKSDYVGYKRNLGLGIGIGRQVGNAFRLRLDAATGIMNGNNNVNYYETTLYEGQLGVDINILKLINKNYDGIKLNAQTGVGMMMYYARLYDRVSGAKVVESPVRDVRSFSPNAIFTYGLNIGVPITDKLDFNFGVTNRVVDNVDWMDGQKSGDHSDKYGMIQVGLVYYLKNDRTPGTTEVDTNRYKYLVAAHDTLKVVKVREEQVEQELATAVIDNQEKASRIIVLERRIDSIQSGLIANVDTSIVVPPAAGADADALLATQMYRVVVCSMPSKQLAQRWIDKTNLDKSEMIIAYIPELDTYRVVYKSFATYPAARKELLKIKSEVRDAWVVQF